MDSRMLAQMFSPVSDLRLLSSPFPYYSNILPTIPDQERFNTTRQRQMREHSDGENSLRSTDTEDEDVDVVNDQTGLPGTPFNASDLSHLLSHLHTLPITVPQHSSPIHATDSRNHDEPSKTPHSDRFQNTPKQPQRAVNPAELDINKQTVNSSLNWPVTPIASTQRAASHCEFSVSTQSVSPGSSCSGSASHLTTSSLPSTDSVSPSSDSGSVKPVVQKGSLRWCYTDKQLQKLERFFIHNPYPDSDLMDQLAEELQVPEKKLRIWFQNKRARTRRRLQAYGPTPFMPATLLTALAPNVIHPSNRVPAVIHPPTQLQFPGAPHDIPTTPRFIQAYQGFSIPYSNHDSLSCQTRPVHVPAQVQLHHGNQYRMFNNAPNLHSFITPAANYYHYW